MFVLALSDGWQIAMFVVNVIVVVIVAWQTHKQKQRDESNKRRDDRIAKLETDLDARASELIESKLTSVVAQLEGVINVVNERITNVRERLAIGDTSIADLVRRDQEMETRVNVRFDRFKDFVHQNFATKAEAAALHKRIDIIKYPPQGDSHGQ